MIQSEAKGSEAIETGTTHPIAGSPATTNCPFCGEVQSRQLPVEYTVAYGVDSRICYETDDLFVVPSVSPVSPGHVLILSRAHLTRLADLPMGLLPQLSDCIHYVEQRLHASFGSSVYFAEHGVKRGQMACGIDHAHLHMMALPSQIIGVVERDVEAQFPQDWQGALVEVLKIGASRRDECYLVHGPSTAVLRIAFAEQIPSQYMRRLIAKARAQSEWDWRDLYGSLDFVATRDALNCA